MNTDKINRTIATRILGWKSTKWQNHFVNDRRDSVDVRDKFTNDIKYAWMVVEALNIRITPLQDEPEDSRFCAEILGENERIYFDAFAPTAPLAICAVALQSIGLDIQDIA